MIGRLISRLSGVPWAWVIAAAIAAWAALEVSSARSERDVAKAAYAKLKSDVETATAKAEAADAKNIIETERAQSAVTTEVDRDVQDQLATARARAEQLRRELAAARGGRSAAAVPGVPDASRIVDGPAEQDGFLDTITITVADALTATEQAIRLEGLQSWVKQQQALDAKAREEK